MNKFLEFMKNFLFKEDMSIKNQLSLFIVVGLLGTFAKILFIIQSVGEEITTSFQTLTWIFMIIWTILTAFKYFERLQGYFALGGMFIFLSILFFKTLWATNVAFLIVGAGTIMKIILIMSSLKANKKKEENQ